VRFRDIAGRSRQAQLAAAVGTGAAIASLYAWHLTTRGGHIVAATGFLILGFAWGRAPAIAWLGAVLILGGSIVRWIG
jgi:hypothetical protein